MNTPIYIHQLPEPRRTAGVAWMQQQNPHLVTLIDKLQLETTTIL